MLYGFIRKEENIFLWLNYKIFNKCLLQKFNRFLLAQFDSQWFPPIPNHNSQHYGGVQDGKSPENKLAMKFIKRNNIMYHQCRRVLKCQSAKVIHPQCMSSISFNPISCNCTRSLPQWIPIVGIMWRKLTFKYSEFNTGNGPTQLQPTCRTLPPGWRHGSHVY